jgi:serine/threonine protein kinase
MVGQTTVNAIAFDIVVRYRKRTGRCGCLLAGKGATMSLTLQLEVGAEPFPGYRLRQLRGTGGFAQVWESSTPTGGTIALKFMSSKDQNATAKELRSIQAVRMLNHPGLLRIERVWTQPGYIVIAMELADGSLHDLMCAYQQEFKAQIPPENICPYLLQVAEALDFMNARVHPVEGRKVGYLHCDVKPGNMLIVGEAIKLADFGLSSVTTGTTRGQASAGTPDFAPPEVFQGQLHDRSDQFALAVSYCVLRTGNYPFPEPPPGFPPGYVRPAPDLNGLTEAEKPILRRGLATIPQGRWPTCTDMMSRLCRIWAPDTLDLSDTIPIGPGGMDTHTGFSTR